MLCVYVCAFRSCSENNAVCTFKTIHEGNVETFLGALQFTLQTFLVLLSFCKLFHTCTRISEEQVPSEISTSKFAPACSNVAYTIARLFRGCLVLWLRSYTFVLVSVCWCCECPAGSNLRTNPTPYRLQKQWVSSPSGSTMAPIATTYLGGDAASQLNDQYEFGCGNVFGQRNSMT